MYPLLLLLLLPPTILLLHHRRRHHSTIPTFHPLSTYTTLPILLPTLLGHRNKTIHAAHIRHGPIIRLSPTEISLSSPETLSTIYTSFPKPSWYNIFRNYGIPPMFSLLPGKSHAARKKILAGSYSNSVVSRSAVLREVAGEVIPDLLSGFEDKEVEVWSRFVELAMDFVTAFLFTREVGSRFLSGEDEGEILRRYHSRRGYFAVSSELPWLSRWVVPGWVDDANAKIEAWCERLCEARRGEWKDGEEKCVIDRLLSSGLENTQIASEMLDHIGAGHETTALALSFTLAAMSTRPEMQRELRRSLEPLLEERDGWRIPRLREEDGYKALEEHALLNAIIKESLRLYAPIPGSQPRVAPRNMEILGYFVPAGTTVSSQAWTLHRDPAIWGDDVEEFLPKRWMEGRGVEKAWWAFGSGGRGCIGQYLARWELRVVVASVYANYETMWKGEAVKVVDAYTTAPVEDVMVGFRRV
ncbi:cytochrome P450 [Trichophaea hybrida]|nr:cytochrome P450 [Trichophaea hybrida]